MSKRVKLDKSELIDIILEEVEAALTDEATSLGQKDPKYKKFPSTIFYADVADEYRAILPVVEKLLEANPQDRPYIADALEMMMFNVRDGIHGPEMDESRLDEEDYDRYRDENPEMHRQRPRFPQQSREQALASSMSSFLKGLEKYEKTKGQKKYGKDGDKRWLPLLKKNLSNFRSIADVRKAITNIMNDPNRGPLAYKIDPNDAPALMKKAVKFLPSNEQLAENEYREYAMKQLEALKAALENAKSELQKQRIGIKIQKLARTMKDMGDALPSLEERSLVDQAMSTLRGSNILKAYENGLKQNTAQFMQNVMPKSKGPELDAWNILMADLRGKLELEEQSE